MILVVDKIDAWVRELTPGSVRSRPMRGCGIDGGYSSRYLEPRMFDPPHAELITRDEGKVIVPVSDNMARAMHRSMHSRHGKVTIRVEVEHMFTAVDAIEETERRDGKVAALRLAKDMLR